MRKFKTHRFRADVIAWFSFLAFVLIFPFYMVKDFVTGYYWEPK